MKRDHRQEVKWMKYSRVGSHLLKKYATEDVILKADSRLDTLKDYAGKITVCVSKVLKENGIDVKI